MSIPLNQRIDDLFVKLTGHKADSIAALPLYGSNRRYFRCQSSHDSLIAVYNQEVRENRAFIGFSEHFRKHQMNVPKVMGQVPEGDIYLQEDLGDNSLFDFLMANRDGDHLDSQVEGVYFQVIDDLSRFQVLAGADLDYNLCYPYAYFDHRAMLWDMNYFKYWLLKPVQASFDEAKLEYDFNQLANILLQTDTNHFMYRDFKSLNIMLVDNKPYYIDFQGGRRGALHYDLASLLFEAAAELPSNFRLELKRLYISAINRYQPLNEESFDELFVGYALIRIMQAFATFGFRGLWEKKQHYINSIPPMLNNLSRLMDSADILKKLPELSRVLKELPDNEYLNDLFVGQKSE